MTSTRAHVNVPNTDTPVSQFTDLLLQLEVVTMYTVYMDARILSITPEDRLDNIETYEEITAASYYEPQGLPESFVQRLGMAEVRVLTVHINAYAFRHSIQRVRQKLRSIFAKAIMSYVDFITGDFNLFANMQFKSDTAALSLEDWLLKF